MGLGLFAEQKRRLGGSGLLELLGTELAVINPMEFNHNAAAGADPASAGTVQVSEDLRCLGGVVIEGSAGRDQALDGLRHLVNF